MKGMAKARRRGGTGGSSQRLSQHLPAENPLRRLGWREAAEEILFNSLEVEKGQQTGERAVRHVYRSAMRMRGITHWRICGKFPNGKIRSLRFERLSAVGKRMLGSVAFRAVAPVSQAADKTFDCDGLSAAKQHWPWRHSG